MPAPGTSLTACLNKSCLLQVSVKGWHKKQTQNLSFWDAGFMAMVHLQGMVLMREGIYRT